MIKRFIQSFFVYFQLISPTIVSLICYNHMISEFTISTLTLKSFFSTLYSVFDLADLSFQLPEAEVQDR